MTCHLGAHLHLLIYIYTNEMKTGKIRLMWPLDEIFNFLYLQVQTFVIKTLTAISALQTNNDDFQARPPGIPVLECSL